MTQSKNKTSYVYDMESVPSTVSRAIRSGVESEGSFPKLVNGLLYKCWAYEGDERAAKVREAVEYLADKTITIGGNDNAENVFARMLDKMQEESGYSSMPEALRPKIPIMKVDEKTLTRMRDEIIDAISDVVNSKVENACGDVDALKLANAGAALEANKAIAARLDELMRVVNQYDATGETTLDILGTIKKAAIDIGGKAELEINRSSRIINAERERRDAERKRLADLEAEAKRQAAEAENAAREAREAAKRAARERELAEQRKQALEESEKRRVDAERRAEKLAEEARREANKPQPVIHVPVARKSGSYGETRQAEKHAQMSFTDAFAAVNSPYNKMTGSFPVISSNDDISNSDAGSVLDALANAYMNDELESVDAGANTNHSDDIETADIGAGTLDDDDFDDILGSLSNVDDIQQHARPLSFTNIFGEGNTCRASKEVNETSIDDNVTHHDASRAYQKHGTGSMVETDDFDDDALAGLSSLLGL